MGSGSSTKGRLVKTSSLRLPIRFEDAVSALLRTPPPPKDAMPERPKAKKALKRKRGKKR
jgi:hypothetical protein